MSNTPVAFVPETQVARARLAEGPLSEFSFAAKDLFAIRGHRASAGQPDWARTHPAAEQDAPAITRLLSAGADLVGVTIMDELAFSLTGQNVHYGTPANPRAPERLCGGSSCGSAAAVASCLCDFALGTDTGGSVRVPASFCGLYGLRPSHGRITTQGTVPLAPSFDTVGFLARDARTFDAVASVLLDAEDSTAPAEDSTAPATPQRVLVADDALARCDAGMGELLEHLLGKLTAKLGIPVERALLAPQGFEALRTAYQRIQGREAWAAHGEWITQVKPNFSAPVAARFAAARALHESGEGAAEDAELRAALSEHVARLLTPGTLLFLPAAPGVAPRRDASEEALDRFRARALELTSVASLTGIPQLVLPAQELEGAPIGLSFAAARGADELLCGLALHAEQAVR